MRNPSANMKHDRRSVTMIGLASHPCESGFDRDGRFDIRTANNGFDAGMGVKEFRPDLVILDVMLPDINGKEVCQRVRNDPSMDMVKILCISGMVEHSKVDALKAAGADDFMQKPFAIEELVSRACDLLEIERGVVG